MPVDVTIQDTAVILSAYAKQIAELQVQNAALSRRVQELEALLAKHDAPKPDEKPQNSENSHEPATRN